MTSEKIKTPESKESTRVNVAEMTKCAFLAALLCIVSPVSVPIGPVPVSLSLLAVYFCVFLMGTKRALISCGLYILIGFAGMPVFSGYTGGVAKLFGPTGGYILGYIPLVLITGKILLLSKKWYVHFAGAILGLVSCYAIGTGYFMFLMKMPLSEALALCVYPFVAFDIVKIITAMLLAHTIKLKVRNNI
jgi:biotin transport system substrate-specific component